MRARRRKSPAPRPFLCDRNGGENPMKIWGLPFIDNLECICYKPTNCCSVIKPNSAPDFPGGVVMNKAELTARVAKDTKMTKVQAARVIDSLLEHITKTLKRGERSSLVGFGTFTIAKRRERVLGLVRAEDVGRVEDALAEFGAAIEREGADTTQALASVGSILEDDPRYRPAIAARPGGASGPSIVPFPGLAEAARRLMEDVGLDCLSILDATGVVVSSGHAPAMVGRIERDKLLLPETSSSFIEENITPGIGRVLTLQSRRTVELPGTTLHLVGGRFIDSTFLRRLSPGGTVQALLLDRDGAILTAGDPGNPLPVPPGWGNPGTSRGEYLVRGIPHTYRMIGLRDQTGSAVGTLVAAVSQERLLRLSSSLTLLALAVVAAGAFGSFVIGFALSRGATLSLPRPVQMAGPGSP